MWRATRHQICHQTLDLTRHLVIMELEGEHIWYIKGRVKTPDGVKHYHRVAQDCRLRKEAEAYEEAYRKRLLIEQIDD